MYHKFALPVIYQSFNHSRYAQSYLKHNHPEMDFIEVKNGFVLCKKKDEPEGGFRTYAATTRKQKQPGLC